MRIILTGKMAELRKWIRCFGRISDKKIKYVAIGNDAGEYTAVVDIGTKENYPRQRIVNSGMADQKKSASESSESINSPETIPGSEEQTLSTDRETG